MRDEELIFSGCCLGGVALLAPVILSIVALAKSSAASRAERKVNDLERRLLEMRAELTRMQRGADSYEAPKPAASHLRDHLRPEQPPAPTPPSPTPAPPSPPPFASPPPPFTPPPRPPQPPFPPRPPRPPSEPIRWERIIGVGATAIIGGGALALAGLLFFRYAIEYGFITPAMRVIIGVVFGLSALGASEFLRARKIPAAANALAGGGIVILYAAFWAAHVLYGLIGSWTSGGMMVLVTAVGSLLAVRHKSLFIAIMALAGGFATPILISSGTDRPISLFTYVLLLDAAFLWIAWRRGWAVLAILALVGTVLLQTLWVGLNMGPEQMAIGLGMLGVFAVVFAAVGRLAPSQEEAPASRAAWIAAQAGGVLIPFTFAFYFAGRGSFSVHLWPLAILLALLCIAGSWISREQKNPLLATGTAAGAMGVVAVWMVQRVIADGLPASIAWEAVGICVGLALVFHGFYELAGRPNHSTGPATPALLSAAGFFALLAGSSLGDQGAIFWPWFAGWVALASVLLRQASHSDPAPVSVTTGRREDPDAASAMAPIQILPAVGLAFALIAAHATHRTHEAFPPPITILAIFALIAIALQVVSLLRTHRVIRMWGEYAAAVFPVLILFGLTIGPLPDVSGPWLVPGAMLALTVLALLAAVRAGSGGLLFVAAAAGWSAHMSWGARAVGDVSYPGLAFAALAVLVLTALPFIFPKTFRNDRWAWATAALAAPAWFFPMRPHWIDAFGSEAIGLLPLSLGAISLTGAFASRGVWAREEPIRKSVLAAFAAIALGFVSVAIPMQLDREWVTIGWALEGIAVIWLWRRIDHPGLKWFGLALLAATTSRLVLNVAVLEYHLRGSVPIVNWILYTYWVPALALLGAASLLREHEVPKAKGWERGLLIGKPIGAILCGLAAILVIFVWLNLAVSDLFGESERLTFSFAHDPSRDVARSIAWALYAVILLVIGMVRASAMLRWISLLVLLAAVGKVFLYDLGELKDLYRVASLLGLATCLIGVSFFYQRFVFRRTPEAT